MSRNAGPRDVPRFVLRPPLARRIAGSGAQARGGPLALRWARVPFVLGEPLEAELTGPAGAPAGAAVATLRCLDERLRIRALRLGFAPGRRVVQVLWHAEAPVERAGSRATVRFELPRDPALGTDLASARPRYWELELRGAGPPARFVVPVYAPAALARRVR